MDLSDKKIWFDVEEPKTAVMFQSLFEMFQEMGAEILITARDYDSTFHILDDIAINYYKKSIYQAKSRGLGLGFLRA